MSTNYHEAGHAVAFIAQGYSIDDLSITPDEKSSGRCTPSHDPADLEDSVLVLNTVEETTEFVRGFIRAILAGYEAQFKYVGNRDDETAQQSSDYSMARDIAERQQLFPPGEINDGLRKLREEAEQLVIDNWLAITLVADGLTINNDLSGTSVYCTVKYSDNWRLLRNV